MGAGSVYSFTRGAGAAGPGAGSTVSFLRPSIPGPGPGSTFSFARGGRVPPYGVGPVYQGVASTLRSSGVGPVFQAQADQLREAGAGPTFQGVADEARDGGAGPVFQGEANALKSQGVGPTWQGLADELRESGAGPVFQGEADQLRSYGAGPVFQGDANAIIDLVPIPSPPLPPPIPAPPTTLADDALVVIPQRVELGGEVISTGLASETGDALNKYGEDILRDLAIRQAGATTQNFGRFTGPAYQFGPSWALTLGPKSDVEVIFTSVVNILTTPIGSIPYDPFLGSEVANLVFEPNDAVTQGLIRYFVERDLRRQEPRANVLFVRTVVPENEPHTVVVTVAFQIVGDPEQRVFSAPIEFNTLSLAA